MCAAWSWGALPADGAVDVPLNVVVGLTRWVGGPTERVVPIVRAADGERVATAAAIPGTGIYALAEELHPATEYVLYALGDPRSCEGTDGSVENEIARFTTGTARDDDPPATPVVSGPTTCDTDSCDSSTCCGPYTVTEWRVDVADSVRDVVGYGAPDGSSVSFRFGSWIRALSYPTLDIERVPGPTAFSIFAIDHAGNRSEASAPIDVSRCIPAVVDGGVGVASGASCAASRQASGRATIVAVAMVLAALCRRARRGACPSRTFRP